MKTRKSKDETLPSKRRSFLDILMESYEVGDIDMEGLREEVNTFMFGVRDWLQMISLLLLLLLLGSTDSIR